jgi:hypothetical protein
MRLGVDLMMFIHQPRHRKGQADGHKLVCLIDSAAKAPTDAQRSAARAEAEDRVCAAGVDATDGDPKAAASHIMPELSAAVIRALTQAKVRTVEGPA